MNALHINGNDLTLEAVREVAFERRPVLLDPDARERVNAARDVVDTLFSVFVEEELFENGEAGVLRGEAGVALMWAMARPTVLK